MTWTGCSRPSTNGSNRIGKLADIRAQRAATPRHEEDDDRDEQREHAGQQEPGATAALRDGQGRAAAS